MNAIFSALSVLSFILSCVALFYSAQSVIRLRGLQVRFRSSPLSRLDSLETSLTDTQAVLSELANKVKMMKVRGAVHHQGEPTTDPDPYTQPDEWRARMNAKLKGPGVR